MPEPVHRCTKGKQTGNIFQESSKIPISRFQSLVTEILILLKNALAYKQKYACDGIMIGRAAIGYPWIFNEIKHFFKTGEHLPAPTISDRLLAVRQHAEWSAEWKGERLGLVEMRQHYSNYFRGVPHFKEFRKRFLEVFTLEEMDSLIKETQQFYEEYQEQV